MSDTPLTPSRSQVSLNLYPIAERFYYRVMQERARVSPGEAWQRETRTPFAELSVGIKHGWLREAYRIVTGIELGEDDPITDTALGEATAMRALCAYLRESSTPVTLGHTDGRLVTAREERGEYHVVAAGSEGRATSLPAAINECLQRLAATPQPEEHGEQVARDAYVAGYGAAHIDRDEAVAAERLRLHTQLRDPLARALWEREYLPDELERTWETIGADVQGFYRDAAEALLGAAATPQPEEHP